MNASRLSITGLFVGALLLVGLPAAASAGQAVRHPPVNGEGRAAPPPGARADGMRAMPREVAPPPPSTPPPSSGGQAVPRHPEPASPPPSAAEPRAPGGREGMAMPRPEGQRPRVYEHDRDRDRGYWPGYYYPYGGVGIGYFNPYWWSYSDLWSDGYYGAYDPYAGGAYGYVPEESSGLHLKVKPKQASVYVDGYYVGTVDDFDGLFQKLTIQPGPHRIEVREPGYAPITFDVNLRPGQTITYRGELQRQP
ncbi:MAG: PEGA domain-containing protein [Acidobacteriota bacterium]|nr:PEGA domain-containing protein [Acidobacteriota bacterium]